MWSGLFWTRQTRSPAHSKPCLIGPWTFQDRRTMCVPHSSHTGKHKRIWSGMHVTHNLHVCGSTSSHVCLSAPASSTVTLQPCARCNRRKTDSVCIKKGKSLGSKQHICVNTKGKPTGTELNTPTETTGCKHTLTHTGTPERLCGTHSCFVVSRRHTFFSVPCVTATYWNDVSCEWIYITRERGRDVWLPVIVRSD